MRLGHLALVGAAVFAAPVVSRAAVVYTEDFENDAGSRWVFNSEMPFDVADDGAGNEANFGFDYSTIGIPAAPNSAGGIPTTRGLKLEANVPGTGRFTGGSASPIDLSVPGNFTFRADVWQNFNGPFPGGGNGSTQMAFAGVGTTGGVAQFPGTSIHGAGFAASGDGGTATDYRVYVNTGAPVSPTVPGSYAAGNTAAAQNNTAPYYANNGFGSETATAAQLASFPQQTGSTAAGTQGMAWHTWEIIKNDNLVTWSIDGVMIGTADVTNETFAGDNIFLGYFDINATSSTDANARELLFTVFDNIVITDVIPEPASASVLVLGGLLALRRRRA